MVVAYSMDMSRVSSSLVLILLAIAVSGCSSHSIVPETLEAQVDKTLTFPELIASPTSYQGRVVVVGGEVLKAKRLKEGTQIEILQLPLNKDQEPTPDRTQTQGRLLALQPEFLDPATLAEGTRITMVGEVTGAKTDRLDDVDYRYPTLTVKHWHIWPPPTYDDRRGGPSFGVFGGVGVGGGGGTRSGGGFGLGF